MKQVVPDLSSDELRQTGYELTDIGAEIWDSGFYTNGCGRCWLSRFLSRFAQSVFDVRYTTACAIHDCEWSVSKDLKSNEHRLLSDMNFECNLILDTGTNLTVNKLRLAAWFHAVVVANSWSNYWDE